MGDSERQRPTERREIRTGGQTDRLMEKEQAKRKEGKKDNQTRRQKEMTVKREQKNNDGDLSLGTTGRGQRRKLLFAEVDFG